MHKRFGGQKSGVSQAPILLSLLTSLPWRCLLFLQHRWTWPKRSDTGSRVSRDKVGHPFASEIVTGMACKLLSGSLRAEKMQAFQHLFQNWGRKTQSTRTPFLKLPHVSTPQSSSVLNWVVTHSHKHSKMILLWKMPGSWSLSCNWEQSSFILTTNYSKLKTIKWQQKINLALSSLLLSPSLNPSTLHRQSCQPNGGANGFI